MLVDILYTSAYIYIASTRKDFCTFSRRSLYNFLLASFILYISVVFRSSLLAQASASYRFTHQHIASTREDARKIVDFICFFVIFSASSCTCCIPVLSPSRAIVLVVRHNKLRERFSFSVRSFRFYSLYQCCHVVFRSSLLAQASASYRFTHQHIASTREDPRSVVKVYN